VELIRFLDIRFFYFVVLIADMYINFVICYSFSLLTGMLNITMSVLV